MKKILLLAFSFLTCIILSSSFSLYYMFSNPKIEEILFSIENKTGQITNSVLVSNLTPFVCAVSILIVVTFVLYSFLAKQKRLKTFFLVLLLVNVCNFFYLYKSLCIEDYLFSDNSSFSKQNYVFPSDSHVNFEKNKKNIIRIIVESMEITYSDTSVGGEGDVNLIPELTELSILNQSFSGKNNMLNGAYVPYGATWTMGAIFAQETGISMEANFGVEDKIGFFMEIPSFGKILKKNGFTNYVIRGSDTSFASANDFYKAHGDYVVYDYVYAKQTGLIPNDYSVWWGYEDEKLFEFSKSKLLEISKKSEPFNFTIVTADTHSSNGYMCRLCKNEHDIQYKNVISCSSRQIAEFVEWIQKQSFYNNTVIVITGDHLTMDKSYSSTIKDDYERKTYVNFVNSSKEPQINEFRQYSVFDLFPTMLSAMGATIEGDQLGFGVDLFSSKQTLTEKYGFERFNNLIKGTESDNSESDNIYDKETLELSRKIVHSKSVEEFFELYIKINNDPRFITFLVSQGNISPLLSNQTLINGFESVGLNVSKIDTGLNNSLLAIYGGNKVYEFIVSQDSIIQSDKMLNGNTIHLHATNDSKLSSIRIQTDELSRQCNGLNLMVFNVVDHVGVFSFCLN